MGSSVKGNVNKDVMKIIYFNARSLIPKLPFLRDMHTPDVICITESWLSPDIQDSEILIPGYISVGTDMVGVFYVCLCQVYSQKAI